MEERKFERKGGNAKMTIYSKNITLGLLAILLCMVVSVSFAGTTVIRVETEGSGVINKDTGQQNLNGAMVWNGSEWVANNTWAHKFFMDTRTGQRLKDYNTQTVNGTSPTGNILNFGQYEVTRNIYGYSKLAANGSGIYTYQAVEYVTHDTATARDLILRSRGTGNGTASPYFDAYIQDEAGTQTTALRGDPVWYTYPMVPSEAVNQTDTTAYRTGDFPSVHAEDVGITFDGYYLDIANGADMGPQGFGKSYHLICNALVNYVTNVTGSYPVKFNLKWMDSSGNLQMISYFPSLVTETFSQTPTPTPTPTVVASPTPSPVVSPSPTPQPSPTEPPTAVELMEFKARATDDGIVILKWKTASEVNNAGFNIYRSKMTDGTYKKVNEKLIPAQGGGSLGASYSFENTPGKGTFYYKLEDVDYNGASAMHGPVKVRVRSAGGEVKRRR